MRIMLVTLIAMWVTLAAQAIAPQSAPPQIRTAKIRLQYAQPTEVVRLLGGKQMLQGVNTQPSKKTWLPDGIAAVLAYNADKTLVIRGIPKAVEDLKEMIRLLDIKPRIARLELRFLHVTELPDGKHNVDVLASPVVETPNNVPITITIHDPDSDRDFAARIVPRINGDETISLLCEFRAIDEIKQKGVVIHSMVGQRRVRQGQRRIIAGFLQERHTGALEKVTPGLIPAESQEAPPGYYMEMKATVLPNLPQQSAP